MKLPETAQKNISLSLLCGRGGMQWMLSRLELCWDNKRWCEQYDGDFNFTTWLCFLPHLSHLISSHSIKSKAIQKLKLSVEVLFCQSSSSFHSRITRGDGFLSLSKEKRRRNVTLSICSPFFSSCWIWKNKEGIKNFIFTNWIEFFIVSTVLRVVMMMMLINVFFSTNILSVVYHPR